MMTPAENIYRSDFDDVVVEFVGIVCAAREMPGKKGAGAVDRVRKAGVGVIFITHNVRHALAVGDRFTVINHGHTLGTAKRGEIGAEELQDMMAGGREMVELESSLGGTV